MAGGKEKRGHRKRLERKRNKTEIKSYLVGSKRKLAYMPIQPAELTSARCNTVA